MTLDVIKHHYQHRLWQWHGAMTSTNADVLSIRPWGTSLKEILNEMRTFSLKKMHLKCCLQNTSHFSLVFIVKCALTILATLLLQLTDGVVQDCISPVHSQCNLALSHWHVIRIYACCVDQNFEVLVSFVFLPKIMRWLNCENHPVQPLLSVEWCAQILRVTLVKDIRDKFIHIYTCIFRETQNGPILNSGT